MMAVIASASSQTTDTVISWGDRLPYLYYWDTNWYDYYNGVLPNGNYGYHIYPSDFDICKFIARGCLTSTPLNIIGIASFTKIYTRTTVLDTVMEHRLPEYYRLFVIEGDSLVLLAQTRWDTVTPDKSLELRTTGLSDYITLPLYEAYFDKPVLVEGRFFVGGTAYNNYLIRVHNPDPNPWACDFYYHAYYPTQYYVLEWYLGTPDPGETVTLYYNLHVDDERDTFAGNIDTTTYEILNGENYYVPIFFAIFDTSYTYNPPVTIECLPPTGLRLEDIDTATATLTWNYQDSTMWQLQVFNADSIPDSSVFIDSLSVNMAILSDLDTAVTYAARLRTVCSPDTSSEWTDTIQFRLVTPPDDSTGVGIRQDSPVDVYTHLFPNPATSSLTIVSSFHLQRIEIFSANGRRVLSSPARGISKTLDISGLAPATYIVHITTPSGSSTKRLVKK